jgi:hypothetical protein
VEPETENSSVSFLWHLGALQRHSSAHVSEQTSKRIAFMSVRLMTSIFGKNALEPRYLSLLLGDRVSRKLENTKLETSIMLCRCQKKVLCDWASRKLEDTKLETSIMLCRCREKVL